MSIIKIKAALKAVQNLLKQSAPYLKHEYNRNLCIYEAVDTLSKTTDPMLKLNTHFEFICGTVHSKDLITQLLEERSCARPHKLV